MQELFEGDVILAVLFFPLQKGYLGVLYWLITIGIITSFILCKKHIGTNRWRWVTLFSLEILALVLAFSDCAWGFVPGPGYWFGFLRDYQFARAGLWVFSIQILITLRMCISFRKNKNQQPPKPPKREFCGDV